MQTIKRKERSPEPHAGDSKKHKSVSDSYGYQPSRVTQQPFTVPSKPAAATNQQSYYLISDYTPATVANGATSIAPSSAGQAPVSVTAGAHIQPAANGPPQDPRGQEDQRMPVPATGSALQAPFTGSSTFFSKSSFGSKTPFASKSAFGNSAPFGSNGLAGSTMSATSTSPFGSGPFGSSGPHEKSTFGQPSCSPAGPPVPDGPSSFSQFKPSNGKDKLDKTTEEEKRRIRVQEKLAQVKADAARNGHASAATGANNVPVSANAGTSANKSWTPGSNGSSAHMDSEEFAVRPGTGASRAPTPQHRFGQGNALASQWINRPSPAQLNRLLDEAAEAGVNKSKPMLVRTIQSMVDTALAKTTMTTVSKELARRDALAKANVLMFGEDLQTASTTIIDGKDRLTADLRSMDMRLRGVQHKLDNVVYQNDTHASQLQKLDLKLDRVLAAVMAQKSSTCYVKDRVADLCQGMDRLSDTAAQGVHRLDRAIEREASVQQRATVQLEDKLEELLGETEMLNDELKSLFSALQSNAVALRGCQR